MNRAAIDTWPASRLREAVEGLAVLHRLSRLVRRPAPPAPPLLHEDVNAVVRDAAVMLGVEARKVRVPYAHVKRFLRSGAPGLIGLGRGPDLAYLALTGCRRGYVVVLQPDLSLRQVSLKALCSLFRESLAESLRGEVDQVLAGADVSENRRSGVRAALLEQQLLALDVPQCWLIGALPSAMASATVMQARVLTFVVFLAAAHGIQHVLLILSWWVLGAAVLRGDTDFGWLIAWALLLVSVAPFRGLEQWLLGSVAARLGVYLRQQLLDRIVGLPVDVARREGAGQWLGCVIESEAVESMVVSGGHIGLVAAVELALALPILTLGAGGLLHATILLTWCGISLFVARRYWKLRRRWTAARLRVTEQMVESMVGYRTRLAQEHPADWHAEEDGPLADYAQLSREMDRCAAAFRGLIPRGWLVVGVAALTPAFVSNEGGIASIAVAIGGVLIAYKALWKLVRGLSDLVDASVSWSQIRPLLATNSVPENRAVGTPIGAVASFTEGTVLEARGVRYQYPGRGTSVLAGCDLKVRHRDRILIEGVSGAGKTTLAAVLGGLRTCEGGLLLLGGLDRHTIGQRAWRERVVTAPQFNENHVFTGTFAFNLLLGRRCPPSLQDLIDAEKRCHQLGLGQLLERMPAGLMQMVGDGGWQLSHGERARLFMARALIQHADLVIIDEGLGALDPETRMLCLSTLLKEPSALILVAHA